MSKSERPVFAPRSEKQRMILMDDSTDLLLCGGGAGGSKSFTCLLKALKYCQDPAARVLIVRKTFPLLKLPGGLIDESQNIYRHFGAEWRVQPSTWVFPNGAEIKFAPIPHDMQEWQGLQATHILIDEAADESEELVLFLLSRLRSARYKGHMNITMTCNPDRASFLYPWVEYCLDPETGIPKEGTENITRYFVNVDRKIRWGDSVEELYEQWGKGKTLGVDFAPVSFRFIPLTVYDNPVLLKANPAYLMNLLNQPRVNQQRYLHGSWTARAEGSSYFDRDWVEFVDYPPTNPVAKVRSWDLAASVPSETSPNPDWTAGVLMSRDSFGTYYIEDVYRFQKLTDGVLKDIVATAKNDGLDIPVTIPRDSGSGGKAANSHFTRTLAEHGISVRSVVMSGHSGKVQRFLPFCSLAEGRNVKIVRGAWNDDYLTELEHFTGGRNEKNDQVDATSDAFNTLAKQIQIPTFSIPNFTQPSPIPKV